MSITTAQIRGARGLLGWNQSDLSDRTGISTTSIGAIENGNTQARESTLVLIRRAFEGGGVEFIGQDGVRIRNSQVRTYSGKAGFWDFYEDVYNTVVANPGKVLVSNVDERDFEKWLAEENLKTHVERMRSIQGLSYQILIREGDTHFLATPDYCEYRWIPKKDFTSVPFYIYGDKMAVLLFNVEPTVIVIQQASVADAYRKQFASMWDNSMEPKGSEIKSND